MGARAIAWLGAAALSIALCACREAGSPASTSTSVVTHPPTPDQVAIQYIGVEFFRLDGKSQLVGTFTLTNNADIPIEAVKGLITIKRVDDGGTEVENWPFDFVMHLPSGKAEKLMVNFPIERTIHNLERAPGRYYSASLRVTEVSTDVAGHHQVNIVETVQEPVAATTTTHR